MTEQKKKKNSLTAGVLCCGRLRGHGAVDPLGVVGDDGVYSGFPHLPALLPSIGSDAHCNAVVEQRTSGITLTDGQEARRRAEIIMKQSVSATYIKTPNI